MKQRAISTEEIVEKIKDVDKLPTHEEAEKLFHSIYDRFDIDYTQKSWIDFCEDNKIYEVYNTKFIDSLAEEIKKLNKSPIIEICAGDGKLSNQLRKKGIDIVATDDYSWRDIRRYRNLVERLSHKEALRKYNPGVVIASWVPQETRIGFDVLDFPSVKYLIDIGEDIGGGTWITEEIYDRKDFERTSLKNVEEYALCRTDYPDMHNSYVSLFTSLKNKHNGSNLLCRISALLQTFKKGK